MNTVRASAFVRGFAAMATAWSSGCATEAVGPTGNGAVDDDPCHEAVCIRAGRCAAGQSSAQFQRQATLPAMVRKATKPSRGAQRRRLNDKAHTGAVKRARTTRPDRDD